MSEIDAIEKTQQGIVRLIAESHKHLNYWQILKLFWVACQDLMQMSEVEYQLKQRE